MNPGGLGIVPKGKAPVPSAAFPHVQPILRRLARAVSEMQEGSHRCSHMTPSVLALPGLRCILPRFRFVGRAHRGRRGGAFPVQGGSIVVDEVRLLPMTKLKGRDDAHPAL